MKITDCSFTNVEWTGGVTMYIPKREWISFNPMPIIGKLKRTRLWGYSEYGNYASRVKLVHNAFGNLSYSEARLRSLQSSPTHQAELDLVIVNPQGESVAYCMRWVEENDPKSCRFLPEAMQRKSLEIPR